MNWMLLALQSNCLHISLYENSEKLPCVSAEISPQFSVQLPSFLPSSRFWKRMGSNLQRIRWGTLNGLPKSRGEEILSVRDLLVFFLKFRVWLVFEYLKWYYSITYNHYLSVQKVWTSPSIDNSPPFISFFPIPNLGNNFLTVSPQWNTR